MTIDLTPYQADVLAFHAAVNNTAPDVFAQQYVAAVIADALEPGYVAAQAATLRAALRDDKTRAALKDVLASVAVAELTP